MPPWRKRFFESTAGRLIGLLRRRPLTVDEMAGALGVTDNAVRAQLTTLERDGLVEQRGLRRGAGKPAYTYGPTPDLELALSRAYAPLLVQLLAVLGQRLPEGELTTLLREVGRRWGATLPPDTGDPHARAAHAARLLEQLGGAVEIQEQDGRLTVRGFSCPLALAVRSEPRVCAAVETLLGTALGLPVHEECDRSSEAPRCAFMIGAAG